MKALVPFLCVALAAATLPAAASQQARTPIKPISDCIRVDQINEWYVVDPHTAIVRTGPKRFRVNLQNDCPRLLLGPPGLLFHPNQSNLAIGNGRICGEVGETVSSREQPPCAIQSVEKIDKADFDRMALKARRHGTAADQPTATP